VDVEHPLSSVVRMTVCTTVGEYNITTCDIEKSALLSQR
jgi:hypothetical protein